MFCCFTYNMTQMGISWSNHEENAFECLLDRNKCGKSLCIHLINNFVFIQLAFWIRINAAKSLTFECNLLETGRAIKVEGHFQVSLSTWKDYQRKPTSVLMIVTFKPQAFRSAWDLLLGVSKAYNVSDGVQWKEEVKRKRFLTSAQNMNKEADWLV